MKKAFIFIISLAVILIIVGIFLNVKKDSLQTAEPVVSILPEIIHPGDPVFITINSSSTPDVIFDGKSFKTFLYQNKYRTLIAIDFNEKILEHDLKVTLNNGQTIQEKITITPREKIERPLGIPDKLGGNTPQAEKALLDNLAKENKILNSVKTATTTLWSSAFGYPLANLFITDDYGYDRKTVNSTIVHKGTDFRAAEGTPVAAMNDGVVKIAKTFIIYGNTIVVDHGQGLQTFYMHLSQLDVKEGEKVKKGQVIGLSGKTGYAESPHLHISVRINGISIDPMTFISFFQ